MILAESSEPQPSNIPALGEYDDRRQQLEKERNIEYNQHLAAVCDITLWLQIHFLLNVNTLLMLLCFESQCLYFSNIPVKNELLFVILGMQNREEIW